MSARLKWIRAILAALLEAGIAIAVTRALSGDLETLVGCGLGLIYVRLRSDAHTLKALVEAGLAVVEGTEQAALEIRKNMYELLFEGIWSWVLQLILAWPLAKLFWNRLVG